MSEGTAQTPFDVFYTLVKRAYPHGSKDALRKVRDYYFPEPVQRQIQEGLAEHLKDRVSIAPLLESSGVVGVVQELSFLVMALHHVGLGQIVGDAFEELDYQEREDFQEYLQEGIEGEEDSERRDQLINAVRSLSGSQ